MNQLQPHEIERRLRHQPSPEPPEGLLERIRTEIPEISPLQEEDPTGRPSSHRRWLIAASVVVAVGGGFLGYRTLQEAGPLAPARYAEPSAAADQEAGSDAEAEIVRVDADSGVATASTAPESTPELTQRQREQLRHLGYGAGGEPRATSDDRLLEHRQLGAEGDQTRERPRELRDEPEVAAVLAAPAPPMAPAPRTSRENEIADPTPAAPPASDVLTVTSESPLLDEALIPDDRVDLSKDKKPEMVRVELNNWAREQTPPKGHRTQQRPSPSPSTGGTAEPNDQPYGDVFYRDYGVHPFVDTEDDRLSTFGLDVDTGSYGIARRYLDDGHLPPREAIRVEELLNYFDYGDAAPEESDFALYAEMAPAPFAAGERYHLVRFGLRGREIAAEDRKPATLVFVVDTSGSMQRENRLGLVRQSLLRLLEQLREDDRVGLVVYGSRAEVLQEPTTDLARLRAVIGSLRPSGSTNAEQGLLRGYQLAGRYFREGAINRIILCSDGVANVGNTGPESILRFIGQEARRGIELTTVGFGMGNYNDVLMEQLADRGNGRYAYVDDLAEAHRIFVENLTGTLQTIAADAKVQVEFDPAVVSRYRLLGYENRAIPDEQFRNDAIDAGEIGAGHSVTALYEIKLHKERPANGAIATLHLRYRSKRTERIEEVERTLRERDGARSWRRAPRGLQLAATVAELGERLKGSYWSEPQDAKRLLEVAQQASARYPGDPHIAELVGLVAKAIKLSD